MKVSHTEKEPIYFDHYDPEALANILDIQHKITMHMKSQGRTDVSNISNS